MTQAVRNAQSQAWQAMLAVHGAVFGRLSRELSQEFGITLAKYDVLAQLHRFPKGLNQRDLSRCRIWRSNVFSSPYLTGGLGLATGQ